MFKTFFFLELKYTLKQPMVYIFIFIFALLEFFSTVSDNIQIGGAVGNVYRNSPYTITFHISVLCVFGLLMAIAFFNNAALRDYNNGFNEILFTTPLSKPGYFFGRFFGALIISTLPMIGAFIGILSGTLLNSVFEWTDTSRYGPFYLETFISNYLLFILPNMFFVGTIIYAMANKWRNTVISFVGVLIVIIAYVISDSLMSDIDSETIAGLSDVFAINTYDIETQYYTPVEKNTLNPKFSGLLLWNRLIWTGLGLIILLISYSSFSFKEKNKKKKKEKEKTGVSMPTFIIPEITPTYNRKTVWLQLKSLFYINFLSIIKSITFKIIFLFSAIILIADLSNGFEYFGLQSYPLTYKVIDSINDNTDIFIIIILVFFSGELIWRDRDRKINEVIDTTAHISFISMVAKALSLVSITVILHFFFFLIGIIYQLLNEFTRIELDVYLLDFIYDNLAKYIIYSGVMILIQVLVNNKYIGYFVSVLVIFAWNIILTILDISSNMLNIGASPFIEYSDMNNFGPGLKGTLWFNAYWMLFSILCLLISGALWNRGSKKSLLMRFKIIRKQIPKNYRGFIVITALAWILTGSVVYYNSQILNPYRSKNTQEELAVSFEKKYGKYKTLTTPKITNVKYYIDIFPAERNVNVKADVELTNETEVAIDSLHFYYNEDWETSVVIPNSGLVFKDETYLLNIFKLNNPLQPGESIIINIENKYSTKGFKNNRGNTNIINNGTFLNSDQVMPIMGYNEACELSDKNTRKKYGLAPKERMPRLMKDSSEYHMKNYLNNGQSDFINVETIISTSNDQTAIAPGSLINKWSKKDRDYYHYKTDIPSLNFYAFISAKYEIAKRKWNGIDIEIYHDKKHPENVEMMLNAILFSQTMPYYRISTLRIFCTSLSRYYAIF